MVVRLRHRVALHHHLALAVNGVGDARAAVFERIGPRPVGRLAVEELAEQRKGAAPELRAPPAVHIGRGAVVGVVVGDVAAGVDVEVRGEGPFLHYEVHDTGDSVRAVLSRRSVPEDFHTVDGALGDRVQVHAARAGAHAVREVVDQGGLVLTPAIHEHQRLVGAQAA